MITHTALRALLIRFGDCRCSEESCSPACAPCGNRPESDDPCLREAEMGMVPLRPFERAMQQGYANRELPCPFGSGQCTTAGGHWYHGDCERDHEKRSILGPLGLRTVAGEAAMIVGQAATPNELTERYNRLIRASRSQGIEAAVDAHSLVWPKRLRELASAYSVANRPGGLDPRTLRAVAAMLQTGKIPSLPKEAITDDSRKG